MFLKFIPRITTFLHFCHLHSCFKHDKCMAMLANLFLAQHMCNTVTMDVYCIATHSDFACVLISEKDIACTQKIKNMVILRPKRYNKRC